MDTSKRDAGCTCPDELNEPLPGTTPAPSQTPTQTGLMTACRASALIQKRIA